MKAFLILILSFSFALATFGQTLSYTKVNDESLVHILNNLTKLSQYKSDSCDLIITVYSIDDLSGSAGFANDEITNSIYIAVSEYGEAPNQSLFKLSSIYNPKFVKWIGDKKEPKFILAYGISHKREKATIIVNLHSLTISVK